MQLCALECEHLEAREGVRVSGSCEAPNMYAGKQTPYHLQDQKVLRTTEHLSSLKCLDLKKKSIAAIILNKIISF